MAILTPYHPTLQRLLESQPRKGEGHRWFYRVAIHFRHYHHADQCFAMLRACADQYDDRRVPDEEIWKAVNKAYAATIEEATDVCAWDWPSPSPEAIERVLASTPPLPLESLPIDAGKALPALYQYDELVCIGMSQSDGGTATLQEVMAREPWTFQYVVPSPMTAREGRTQTGRPSFRCNSNTGKRRYLVVESDNSTREQQARILQHLSQLPAGPPLIIVVDSAGKSLHGWFNVAGWPDPLARAFFSYAVWLGSDPHTWTRCQWVRMPGGTRYTSLDAPKIQPIVWACDAFQQETLA